MISLPEYKVMGEDGQEYGPVSAAQIRRWIADGRLERKSPVKVTDSRDWVFLESLQEFADAFQPPMPLPPSTTTLNRRGPSAMFFTIYAM